jgi:hypothetical protein
MVMGTRKEEEPWKRGEAGAELAVAVRARSLGETFGAFFGGGLAIALCVSNLKSGQSFGNQALLVLVGAFGAALILWGRPRNGRLRINDDTLAGPSWGIVFTSEHRLALHDLGAVNNVPLTNALGAPSEFAELRITRTKLKKAPSVSYRVLRSEASELAHRLGMRIAGTALDVPQAARMLELYYRPGAKPLGLAYLHNTWIPFESPRALFEASTAHPFRDRQSIRVFMASVDFQMVVDAYPQLQLERIGMKMVERR